ncbi:hypothetical protein ACIRG5_38775 [Lentzea sp. NPDC102401]|uniref:hypothetical protein n=1 Tax=Lentzea sp. NPDC102401 TaxID=3364128 RepID=UPI00382F7A9F
MTSLDEIERRVEEADAARSRRRSAAARCISELAALRSDAAAKLADIERELGDVLAESSDVISVEELAEFTELPTTDLQLWLNSRKTFRTRRKRVAPVTERGDASRTSSTTAKAPSAGTPGQQQPGVAMPRTSAEMPVRAPAPVT